jgi:hypothetical protein
LLLRLEVRHEPDGKRNGFKEKNSDRMSSSDSSHNLSSDDNSSRYCSSDVQQNHPKRRKNPARRMDRQTNSDLNIFVKKKSDSVGRSQSFLSALIRDV